MADFAFSPPVAGQGVDPLIPPVGQDKPAPNPSSGIRQFGPTGKERISPDGKVSGF